MATRQKKAVALVLTGALLAAGYAYYQTQMRQSATLTRITALETCLAASNQQRARAAKNMVLGISEAVRKAHNMATDVYVLRQAQEIQVNAQILVDSLHRLRQAWQTVENRAKPALLPAQIDRYVAFIRQFLPNALSLTRPSAQSIDWLGKIDVQTAPKPAALAMLTQLETQMRQLAAEALMRQAQKVSSCCFCFDRIEALALPTSQTVAPGTIYQAQLVLALGASNLRFLSSVNGEELPRSPTTGEGLMQLKVPTLRSGQPDTVRAQWQGRVQMTWAATDTALEIRVPYFIVKPHSH